MKVIKNIILFLVIACMHQQDIVCKGSQTKTSTSSAKKGQSIPATLKDAKKAINKKLKEKNISKKDLNYLKKALEKITDIQKQF